VTTTPKSVPSTKSQTGNPVWLTKVLHKRHKWIGYVFILPWFLSFLWFDLLPFLLNIYLSFTDFSVGVRIPEWVGLANYQEIFSSDHLVALSMWNTLYYVGFSVPLSILFAFLLALLLNMKIRGIGFFRTAYYVPSIVPIVASSIIWLVMFRTNDGVVNQFLSLFGVEPIRWLSRPEWAKPALIIMSLWGFGGQMVIYLAGLQGIPNEVYEAAEIDGARASQRLFFITLPLMTPVIFFNLIISVIGAFQVFTAAFIMTGGGPLNSTLFYMLHLYENAFSFFRMGYASALALLLFVVILLFTLVLNWSSERWVFYGADSES
jgi:multiple sugar transport system permease protein